MRIRSYKTDRQALHFVDHFRGKVRFIGRQREVGLTTVTFDDKVKGRTVNVDFPDDLIEQLVAVYNKRDDTIDLRVPYPAAITRKRQTTRGRKGIIEIPRFLKVRKD